MVLWAQVHDQMSLVLEIIIITIINWWQSLRLQLEQQVKIIQIMLLKINYKLRMPNNKQTPSSTNNQISSNKVSFPTAQS